MQKIAFWPAALACLLLCGCAKEKAKETEPVLPVQVSEVRSEPIDRVIHAEGVLRALDQSSVMPKISAPVSKFFANRGDHVQKGQLLATLESKDLAAAVADAKGALDQAEASYRNISSATVPNEIVKAQSDVQSSKEQLDAAKKLLDQLKFPSTTPFGTMSPPQFSDGQLVLQILLNANATASTV
ncbi:MAG: efflux RND transporter periplasmic adaptor subunit, partial [Bryobacteraceae bacterium]